MRATAARPAAVNRLPVAALLVGNIVSLTGSSLTLVALPWFVLQTTGSAGKTGLVGLAESLPAFVVGVLGGAFVDRFGYKRVSVVADLASMIGIVCVPLLYTTVGLAFWQLLLFVFAGSFLTIPGLTARRAMLPELAVLGVVRLERVNASFESANYLAMLLGPPLAGLLVGILGASNVLWLDAASFAVSALTVALAVPPVAAGMRAATTGGYRAALIAGLRFLRGDRLLFVLAINLAVTNFLGSAFFSVSLPVFAKQQYGRATVLGLIVAANGIGQLAGAIVYGAVGHRLPRRALWLVAFTVGPVAEWAVVLFAPLPVILVAMVMGGIVGGPTNPLLVTIRHERIPFALRGRVFGSFAAISQIARPLGMALAGGAIDHAGLRPTLFAFTFCLQLAGFALIAAPTLREMDRS